MADETKIVVNVYDGTRNLIDGDLNLTITIRDNNQKQLFKVMQKGAIQGFIVPFNNNHIDRHSVIVSASKHVQAGFYPVIVSKDESTRLDLMLLPKKAGFDFSAASWTKLQADHNILFRVLSSGASATEARTRYEDFKTKAPGSLSAFFNVTTAARDVILPSGRALSYFKEMIWDEKRMGEDRFFVYADAALVDQVKQAAAQGKFEGQPGLEINHPGATCSYKQKQFGEANIQFSFHENDKKDVEGVPCVKLELDMDYYKSLLSHAILEVIPHKVSKGKTDPRKLYVLRWIAGRFAGVPDFDPPYTIGALA